MDNLWRADYRYGIRDNSHGYEAQVYFISTTEAKARELFLKHHPGWDIRLDKLTELGVWEESWQPSLF